MRVATLVSRQIVGLFVIAYSIGFWRSASRLPDGPAVIYPQMVIIVLVSFIVADLIVTSVRAAKGRVRPEVTVPVNRDAAGADEGGVVASTEDDRDATDEQDATEERTVPDTLRGATAGVWAEHHKTAVSLFATLVYLVAIPRLGFYASTAIFLVGLFAYLGVRQPAKLIVIWAVCWAAIWLLFDLLLSVRLPGGVLF